MKTIVLTVLVATAATFAAAAAAPSDEMPATVGLELEKDRGTTEEVVSSGSKETEVPKMSAEDEIYIRARNQHALYNHGKIQFQKRQTDSAEEHHNAALRMQERGHHGHTAEHDFHTQNLLVVGQKKDDDMHHFHERFLSHAALNALEECQRQIMKSEGGKKVGEQMERRLAQHHAHKSCRTPYEMCVNNALEPHYQTMDDRVADKIDELVIRDAAKHCDHLSSVSSELLAEHRKNELLHYSGIVHRYGSRKLSAPKAVGNPQVFHGLSPHADYVQPYVKQMFPDDDHHSSEMRHCMQHKLTHNMWHEQHGASNPHSFKLAEIQCHHDLHGFYDREHPFHSLEATMMTGLRSPPHTAPPQHLHNIHKRHSAQQKRRRMKAATEL